MVVCIQTPAVNLMNKAIYRRIVQAFAVPIGLLGILIVILAIGSGLFSFLEKDYVFSLFMLPMLLLGVGMSLAAYQVIWRYSLKSIKLISAACVFLLIGSLSSNLTDRWFEFMRGYVDSPFGLLLGLLTCLLPPAVYMGILTLLQKTTLE